MKKMTKIQKRILSFLMAVLIAGSGIAVFMNRGIIADALFDPETALLYSQFKTQTTVDDSVLFVGTYIVHITALTDPILEKAQTSASESGQNDIYYKSELSDGQWFAIDDIDNGLAGISTQGVPVDEAVIDPLYVSYYAGADGILRDAKTMLPINVFDVPDPYDLSKLPELQPLWLQYTYSESTQNISQSDFLKNRNSEQTGNLRSDVYYYQLLSTFFSLDVRDEETNKCDEDLQRLNGCYINLKAAGADEEAALVYDLMEKVDATRRMLVMERLVEMDPNLLNTLNTLATGANYTPYGDFKDSSSDENNGTNPDYINELEDSTKHSFAASSLALNSPWILQWFNRLGIVGNNDGWWTVLDESVEKERKRAEEANSENDDYVYDETPKDNSFAADSALTEAIGTCMSNCSDSYTKHLAKSLEDSQDILGHAVYEYSTQVIASSSSSGLGGPVTYLKHVVNIRDNKVSDKEGELDFLMSSLIPQADSAYTQHSQAGPEADYATLTSDNARSAFLDDQKTDLEADRTMLQFLIDGVRMRDTAPNALAYVYQRLDTAEGLNDSIPGTEFKPYAKSSVEAHIVWLREEAQKIIDSDESLKSEADRLKDKKDELQGKRDAALDDNDLAGAKAFDALIAAVDQDIADAAGSGAGGAGGADSMADALVDKAMDKLADDANADLSGIADALAAVGANDALDKLKDKAAESGASASTLRGIQNAIDSNADGNKGGATEDALLAQLESLFGKSLDEMDDRELAIATATMSRMARSGIEPAASLTSKLMNRLVSGRNKYIYRQYSDKSVEYIDLRVISGVTSYRYFYDEPKATATVTSGSKVYIFKRGSDQMYKGSTDAEPEPMNDAVVAQGALMVGETDANKYFNCTAEYAHGTDYAICLTGPMETAVGEYVTALTEFFKGE